jgi:ribose transport system substrate-binding protein
MVISGLGPHGERAVLAEQMTLSSEDAAAARAAEFRVAIILHTTTSDWAKQEIAGIAETLHSVKARIVEMVDCKFDKDTQNRELIRLAESGVHAVISIPLGNESVAEGHRLLSRSGKTLILLDHAPTGFLPGVDYAAVVSADNFGLGTISAELLSPHVGDEGVAGILTFGVDFFATNQREIGFRKWMNTCRPDVTLVRERFASVEDAGDAFTRLVSQNDDLDGLFVAWDVPALGALRVVQELTRPLAVTTVDLGNEIAAKLVEGRYVKGIAAQLPFEQGKAAAFAILLSLIGRSPPSWIAAPGIAVTPDAVMSAYEIVWHRPLPPSLRRWAKR